VKVVSAGSRMLRQELVDIVEEELNVKAIEFVEQENELVQYKILPDNKVLGPMFGARFPEVRAALARMDPAMVATTVRAGQSIELDVAGEPIELAPESVLVSAEPLPGLAVAFGKTYIVGLDTNITPELKLEGLAREVVRLVQDMRKNAGFNIEDRITTCYQAGGMLTEVFARWGEYIASETLTTKLVDAPPIDGTYVEEHTIEGEKLLLAVKQNK
jgi:isoleucyl-tRNA synthetase